jgi:RHH-type transcriptional regulator, rel operon repressor / antitoxin RelB
MSATITIRVSEETRSELERISLSSQRSKSYIAAEALDAYLDKRRWLEAKVAKADASGVMTNDEVEALFAELTRAA